MSDASAMNMFIAGMLMFTGITIGGTGAFTQAPQDFTQSHPLDGAWLNSGNVDNLQSENGVLSIDNISEGYGVFDSYLFTPSNQLEIDRIIYNASNVREDKSRVIDVTVYGYRDGAVDETSSFTISSNTRRTISTSDVFNSSTYFTGYAFQANLTTTDTNTPELLELTVEGNSLSESNLLSWGFMWLLFGVGALMAARELA